MRTIPANIQSALDSGAAKHCYCWRVELTNGTVMGFTNHDRIISFDGVEYEPESGFTPSEVQTSLGLAVQTQEVEGALISDKVTEDDLRAGLWDNASVEVFLVDWETIVDRYRIHVTTTGQIRNGQQGFVAEMRGITHELTQAGGRFYNHGCGAKLGDAKCGIDLEDDRYRMVGEVASTDGALYIYPTDLRTVSGNSAEGLFAQGKLVFTSGDNVGLEFGILQHTGEGDDAFFVLDNPTYFDIEAGDNFTATIGCNKLPEYCFRFFGNMLNYRGFNLIPGNDRISRPADPEDEYGNDGTSFFGDPNPQEEVRSSNGGFLDGVYSEVKTPGENSLGDVFGDD